jgi:BirA family biotin operon repressor/biotin-[acetyl-CoA-carboxylase] ligase
MKPPAPNPSGLPPMNPDLQEKLAKHLPEPRAEQPQHVFAELRRWFRGEAESAKREHPIGRPAYAFASVSSTMDVAHRLAAEGATEGTLVWAARQEQGRGRQGRTWVSPEGGIYCSIVLKPKLSAPPASLEEAKRARANEGHLKPTTADIPQLSLVAGLSVVESISDVAGLFPVIRWPNDVLLNGLKAAGILVEAKNGAVVIGIGINVTTPSGDLPEGATSITGALPPTLAPPDPYVLTGSVCHRFQKWYDEWLSGGFQAVRAGLRPWMAFFGQPVRLSAGSETYEGTIQDLDEVGRLLVRMDSGIVRQFEMGEVTLLR